MAQTRFHFRFVTSPIERHNSSPLLYPMNIYYRLITVGFAAAVCMSFPPHLVAQEDEVRATPAAESPSPGASTAATTPPLSSSVTPVPTITTGAPALTDVLFKNLKARSIGPAVMGGRISDIAIDLRNPFVFYV